MKGYVKTRTSCGEELFRDYEVHSKDLLMQLSMACLPVSYFGIEFQPKFQSALNLSS